MSAARPRPVPPSPADDTINRFETIRGKSSFLLTALESDMDLTHPWERHELAAIAEQIFAIADAFLEAHAEGGA